MNPEALTQMTAHNFEARPVHPLKPWPLTQAQMRPWQIQAFETVTRSWAQQKSSGGKNGLVVGTPGAGKTDLGLFTLSNAFRSGRIARAVVVVPTSGLKQQWVEAAQRKGITLTANWTNDQRGAEPADTHGVVVTYAQIAAAPEVSRLLTARPTFALFDEIHHAGERSGWGQALQHAFQSARYRLGLSGTPFRSDNSAIPFVRYLNGCCQPDFSYGYSDGLRDGVCRPLIFPSYEGELSWMDGAETRQATFSDTVDAVGASRRLRTALDPLGDWLPSVLKAADDKLTELRLSGHPEAGGLILCMDQKHALAVAGLLRQITGILPAVAVSDDPDSAARVRAFGGSSDRWLVSVRMVSEGVDIPRLRVGVYATNIVAELFFRQAVGRFVRTLPGLEEQSAYVYVPRDMRLIRLVLNLQKEQGRSLRLHAVLDEETLEGTEYARRNRPSTNCPAKNTLFMSLSALAVESSMYAATVGGSHSYHPRVVAQARALKAQNPSILRSLPETTIAEILRLSKTPLTAGLASASLAPTLSAPTHDEESRRLRAKCVLLAARLDRECEAPAGTSHGAWLRETGLHQQGATNAELWSKLHWLQQGIVTRMEKASHPLSPTTADFMAGNQAVVSRNLAPKVKAQTGGVSAVVDF